MPAISKIRFTNVVYDNGGKRYNDDIFQFEGYNGAILLENGGGKTVFIQTAIQTILPHHNMEDRKIRETLSLEGGPCHIAIEWILNEKPRRYLVTAVTLFINNNKLESYKYVYEYDFDDSHGIEEIPFVISGPDSSKRPAGKGEMADYYQTMQSRNMNARLFKTAREYHEYLEENFKIIPAEWQNIARINSAEGGVEHYFENCKTTGQLVDNLLIPVVEEAIAENASKSFVKTFEEQRERFKKHKQLRERIQESQLIQEKIDQYVGEFEKFHEIENQYLKKQQEIKALYLYINEEQKSNADQLQENRSEAEAIEKSALELKRKAYSYDLALLDRQLGKDQAAMKVAEDLFAEVKHRHDEKSTAYYSLKVARIKQEIKEAEESISNAQQQLKRQEAELDIEELQAELEENSAQLKGYFLDQEEGLQKQLDQIRLELEKVMESQRDENRRQEEVEGIKQEQEAEYNKNRGQILEIEAELKRIKQDIVGLEPHETLKNQQQKYMERVARLEEMTVAHKTALNEYQNQQVLLDGELKEDRRSLEILQSKGIILEQTIQTIIAEQESLLLKLKTLNEGWYHHTSVYQKERGILSHLQGKIEGLVKEKEQLLLEERRTGRYQDDYGSHGRFTAEPLLQKWVEEWKTQFLMIETGTKYIQRAAKELRQEEEAFVKAYPYWSSVVVAEEKEIPRLKEKIENRSTQITYPILLLGQQEAMNLIKHGQTQKEVMILPQHWMKNINQEAFENWKENISQQVRTLSGSRREKEEELKTFEQALKETQDFLAKYSYEYYKELEEDLDAVKAQVKSHILQISKKEGRLTEIRDESQRLNVQLSEYKDEVNQLNQSIQTIQRYMTKEQALQSLQEVINRIKEEIEKYKRKILEVKREVSILEDRIQDLKHGQDELKRKLTRIHDDPLYQEVKATKTEFTNRSKAALEEERRQIQELLNQHKTSILHLEAQMKREEQRKADLIKNLERERKESNYPIDEEMAYPLFGDEQLEELLEAINQLKPEKSKLENQLSGLQRHFQRQSTILGERKKQFLEEFDQVVLFGDVLETVKRVLDEEKHLLEERRSKNVQHYEYFFKEAANIGEGIRRLELENAKYGFMAEEVHAVQLPSAFHQEFSYHRIPWIEKSSRELAETKETKEDVQKKLEAYKEKFIHFCNAEIKDPRLRERTVLGVRQKDRYDEIQQWQDRMKKSIQQTIRVAEDDMRDHDRDLEQFVNHLFLYIRTITEELKMIPKKTRIKVEDKWKEIFVFHIPDWDEDKGKEAIRDYIDWMLQELDNNSFKNEDGTENNGSIRKVIEKWLDVKQLLPIVLKNNPIKISCRKVTNDNQISSSLTTWESSNKWSGGEKWSKNMTLFLGLLNYVAEKRQGIQPGLKNSRTVIVDNPFGKASSDHVLDPVFYIAEKLGFQMIALTAHTEGSFIRSYFPVVYSCKLREAINNRSLIIDKEKEIQYAFFRDKNPNTLNRLQEKKQISLFDMA